MSSLSLPCLVSVGCIVESLWSRVIAARDTLSRDAVDDWCWV
jgi:hypothetical protein